MAAVTSVLIVGVGGQGTILASRVLSKAALAAGLDVKVSEVHGMSQRGGSVITQVRFGEAVASPLISQGEADYILAFEKLEALRWISYLKDDGMMVVNDQRLDPMPVITGAAEYPGDVLEQIRARAGRTIAADALTEARNCGNDKAVNMLLLGILSAFLPFDRAVWGKVLEETVPAKFLKVNQDAFQVGVSLANL